MTQRQFNMHSVTITQETQLDTSVIICTG